jgi:hypothetical protein
MSLFTTQCKILQLAANGKLNHRTGTHVDAIRTNTAVHVHRIQRNGLFLLHHILGIIERLQNKDLN